MSKELSVVGILKGFLKDCDNDVLGLARNVYEIALKEVLALEQEIAEAKGNLQTREDELAGIAESGMDMMRTLKELRPQLTAAKQAGEKMRAALEKAQRLMEYAESTRHLNCTDGYIPMMPHGDPEPCEWCITKNFIAEALTDSKEIAK